MKAMVKRMGGRILADQLRIHGVDTVFGVPGESYLAVLDGLYDHRNAIRMVVCRQEGGAAMMADAYGKLTGRPGVCMVTRGPGATNASAGIHIARQDSTPLVMFVGQVARDMLDRDAFQEIDYRQMYGGVAKWVAEIDDVERIPEYVSRAFYTACSGRPGPVVLSLPEDMLADEAEIGDAAPYRMVEAYPSAEQMQEVRDRLARAERPIAILGGGGWSRDVKAKLEAFATANGLAFATTFRRQDYFDNTHACYVGDVGLGSNPKMIERVKGADLVIAIGTRLSEVSTNSYTMIDIPKPQQSFIHVHSGPEELGRVYGPDLAINASSRGFADALGSLAPVDGSRWRAWREEARAQYLEFIKPLANPGDVQMAEILMHLREVLPHDAIITNGAGNYAVWVRRFLQHREYRTQLAPTSGSMGYGVPAAVAASLVHPDRLVVNFSGDGCFMMHGQELATAAQYGGRAIYIVVDNGMYGTIRMHQEREYPGRVSGTELRNPDFAALARAYGGHGETVTRTGQFAEAFERCRKASSFGLIHLKIDPEALTVTQTLSQIRSAALAKKG